MNESIENQLHGLALLLFRDGLLDFKLAKSALASVKKQKVTLTQYLVANNILSSKKIFDYCATHFPLPQFDSKNFNEYTLKENLLHPELILKYRILPLLKDNVGLHIAMTDPTDESSLRALSFTTGLNIHPTLIAEDELQSILKIYFEKSMINTDIEMALAKLDNPQDEINIEKEANEPIIHLVDQLIKDAIHKRISDIHIEPFAKYSRIRFRRDGILYEAATLPSKITSQVISRLKILANLNIAEKRLAQDGRFQFYEQRKIDIRINTCPTLFGEKVVLRLLDNKHLNITINQLGFNKLQQEIFLEKLTDPQGLILVTGPTGSGKTTTLYAALDFLNHVSKNIISIEDPIEIELYGINQVNINTKIGLNFPSALRMLLRQDPDIMMIGEIRDIETADIATQAALTGHLVLSTLHTNSAFETLLRLKSMTQELNFLHALTLIIAQRLIRKLCIHCKKVSSLPFENIEKHYLPHREGCEHCHQGFKGRLAIFEFLPIHESLINLFLKRAPQHILLNQVKNSGFIPLWQAGLHLVREGATSLSELNRVITKKNRTV